MGPHYFHNYFADVMPLYISFLFELFDDFTQQFYLLILHQTLTGVVFFIFEWKQGFTEERTVVLQVYHGKGTKKGDQP